MGKIKTLPVNAKPTPYILKKMIFLAIFAFLAFQTQANVLSQTQNKDMQNIDWENLLNIDWDELTNIDWKGFNWTDANDASFAVIKGVHALLPNPPDCTEPFSHKIDCGTFGDVLEMANAAMQLIPWGDPETKETMQNVVDYYKLITTTCLPDEVCVPLIDGVMALKDEGLKLVAGKEIAELFKQASCKCLGEPDSKHMA